MIYKVWLREKREGRVDVDAINEEHASNIVNSMIKADKIKNESIRYRKSLYITRVELKRDQNVTPKKELENVNS